MNDKHDLANARAYGVDGDNVTFLIVTVSINQPRNQQLASVKTIVLPSGDDGSNYASKNHSFVIREA